MVLPLVVIGMNSIAAYLIAHLFEEFIVDSFHINLGQHAFQIFGTSLEPLIAGRGGAPHLLADSLLDVSQEAIPENMRGSLFEGHAPQQVEIRQHFARSLHHRSERVVRD